MKSGFIALIGRPNAGKSTLLNALMNDKIAIISQKAGTTRNAIRGILTSSEHQMIFVDTPGIHKPIHKLGTSMNKTAMSEAKGVDVVYLVVDSTQSFGTGDEYIIQYLQSVRVPVFLILNKIDMLKPDQVVKKIIEYKDLYDFQEIFPLSALNDNNFDTLLKETAKNFQDEVQYYPSDQQTDYPEQFIISEIVREKVLNHTEEEIPHSVAVVIESMKKKKTALYIQAMILVERDSQKGIIIGKGGQMIRKLGQESRLELEELFGNKIYLELFVRVEKNWRNKQAKLKELGYVEVINLDE